MRLEGFGRGGGGLSLPPRLPQAVSRRRAELRGHIVKGEH
jgi:hypothetical protein